MPTLQSRKTVQVDGEDYGEHDISVVTYNILADFYLQPALANGRHQNCPKLHVAPNINKTCPRHKLLLRELQWLNGDIVCLQEVDPPYFENILKGEMLLLGYEGHFVQKAQCTGRQEGVALFYKQEKFDLKEAKKLVINEIAADILKQDESKEFGEVLILATLMHKSSGVTLVIGTTHILWYDLKKPVTQVCEIALVTQALHNTVKSLQSQGKHVAYILGGDFNIEPHFPAYELLKEGSLNDKEYHKLQTTDYLSFPADVEKPKQVLPEQISLLDSVKRNLHNPLTNAKSAYKVVMGSEPECTSAEDDASMMWTLDYIWFDSVNLKVTSALETLPESIITAYGGFPNEYFPSDHFPLKADFKFIDKAT